MIEWKKKEEREHIPLTVIFSRNWPERSLEYFSDNLKYKTTFIPSPSFSLWKIVAGYNGICISQSINMSQSSWKKVNILIRYEIINKIATCTECEETLYLGVQLKFCTSHHSNKDDKFWVQIQSKRRENWSYLNIYNKNRRDVPGYVYCRNLYKASNVINLPRRQKEVSAKRIESSTAWCKLFLLIPANHATMNYRTIKNGTMFCLW